MSAFIEFLKEYKEVLVSGFCLISTIVLILIKRRPKTIDDFLMIVDEVCLSLPTLINKVECVGNGLAKKKEVRSSALGVISKQLGRSLSESEISFALKTIDSSIEDILSTPQKKV